MTLYGPAMENSGDSFYSISNDVCNYYTGPDNRSFCKQSNIQILFYILDCLANISLLSICSYDLGCGLLAEWGVLDFAGGIVVHATPVLRLWLQSFM